MSPRQGYLGTARRKGRKRISQAYGRSDLLSTLPGIAQKILHAALPPAKPPEVSNPEAAPPDHSHWGGAGFLGH